jgi:hypothetical protein
MQPRNERKDHDNRLEAAARVEFEERIGRSITDAEWVAARTRFLEFTAILRYWEERKNPRPER